jgi:hypothetical protein
MTPKLVLRKVRVLHAAFLAAMFLYVYLLMIVRPVSQDVRTELIIALGVLAVADLNAALFFRTRKVKAPEEKLRVRPDDATALAEWRAGNILSFCFAETICLFGFLLKFLGAGWKIAGPFFGVAILLMVLWLPRLNVSDAA